MKAIIIERWTILRHGLRAVLGEGGHAVVSSVATAAEGAAAVRRAHDLSLVVAGQTDDQPIEELAGELVALAPTAHVLVLVDEANRARIDQLLGSGVAGIVSRVSEGSEVLDAVARMDRGERVLSREVISTLFGVGKAGLAGSATDSQFLTARERETLAWLATGASNREIAENLYIGEATVKTHLASIYAKLDVANRHQAVARGLELGLITWGAMPRAGASA